MGRAARALPAPALARPALALALSFALLALAGCQSTQERSARLERAAKLHQRAAGPSSRGLSIARPSRSVKVIATAVLHSGEGSAAVVTVRNDSARALRDVPIEIHVRDARGASIYANDLPGLGPSLTSLALLPAHAEATWVDDQIQPAGTPASLAAIVGDAQSALGALPRLTLSGRLTADPANGSGAEGSVVNHSEVPQRALVVYAVARRGGRIVAAARAVLAELPARAGARFQVFFIGDARGARLQLSAPATTLG